VVAVNYSLNKKGFTLIEVLISMVILGIILFAFLNLFGTSFANIFTMGNKDQAMATASDIMEDLYRKQVNREQQGEEFDENFIASFLNSEGINYEDPIETINPFENENGQAGFKVTITIPYQSGGQEREISLTSFFRKSGAADDD